jgi:uncharacterized protein (TIGR01777 family)
MKTILIAGGTGLIGSALTTELTALGYKTIVLSRTAGPGKIIWNPVAGKIDIDQPLKVNAIVNLAGSNISAGRWTKKRKEDIVSSRIQSAETLRKYLQQNLLQTSIYIGASGIGFYRNSGDHEVDENTPTSFPTDWMVQTVQQWEDGHQSMRTLNIRTVIVRFGIVLSTRGGALKEIMNYTRFGILAKFGLGKQIWSWIHIRDAVRAVIFAIEHQDVEGILLAVSPNPVDNKTLTLAINHELSIPRLLIPVPRFQLRLMLGEMHSVVFDSCKAIPQRLIEKHFTFLFPEIKSAMKDLLSKKEKKKIS